MFDKPEETLMLLIGGIAVGAILVMLFQQRQMTNMSPAPAIAPTPISNVSNDENWSIMRNSDGFITGVQIKRDVKQY